MKNYLSDVLYADFMKLVEVIAKLSGTDDPIVLTIQLEYFITGLDPVEQFHLNRLVEEYLETGTIPEVDFVAFKNNCRADSIEIDESGRTEPSQKNYTVLRIMTIKTTCELAKRQKNKTGATTQLSDVWFLSCFDGVDLKVNHHIQEELLLNKYRNELVNKEKFVEYTKKVSSVFGTERPWYYVINYCKSKRTLSGFNVFLKTFYEIVDCLQDDPNATECREYAERIKQYC